MKVFTDANENSRMQMREPLTPDLRLTCYLCDSQQKAGSTPFRWSLKYLFVFFILSVCSCCLETGNCFSVDNRVRETQMGPVFILFHKLQVVYFISLLSLLANTLHLHLYQGI